MLVAIKSIPTEFFMGANKFVYSPMKIWKRNQYVWINHKLNVGDYDKPNFQVEFPLQWFHARKQIEMPNNVQLSCVLI